MKYIGKIVSAFIITGVIVAIITIFFVLHYEPKKDLKEGKPVEKKSQREAGLQIKERHLLQEQRIAIIIDDIGLDIEPVKELIKINAPITFAILPYSTYSKDAAEMIHEAGREILLHLPMEPYDYPNVKPGKGAIFIQMNDEKIRKQVQEDLDSVPYVTGVNNHMGSRFMENETKLSIVFKQLRDKRLFFVDSRTTPYSKGEGLAEKIGTPFASRKVFIDNSHDYLATYHKLVQIIINKHAVNFARIIVIGHPYRGTIEALKKAIPLVKAEGIEIVSVSDIIETSGSKDSSDMNK